MLIIKLSVAGGAEAATLDVILEKVLPALEDAAGGGVVKPVLVFMNLRPVDVFDEDSVLDEGIVIDPMPKEGFIEVPAVSESVDVELIVELPIAPAPKLEELLNVELKVDPPVGLIMRLKELLVEVA